MAINLLKRLHLVNPAHQKNKGKTEADYIFHELTPSIIPEYRTLIDSKNLIEDSTALMRKRFPPTAGSLALTDPTPRYMWTSLISNLDKIRKVTISEELNYWLSEVVKPA